MANNMADNPPLTDQPVVRRVLVIEDTPAFAENALALENCRVTLAGDMKTAIALMRGQQFDMVLSDLNFPAREGQDPKRQDLAIAVHCLWHNLPVAVVTRGDPGTERHNGNPFINIHTFTPDDMVFCLSAHGFLKRFNKVQDKEVGKFDILQPGNDVYFEKLASQCTIKREHLAGETVKSAEIWKKAVGMLEASIAARMQNGMARTFSKDGETNHVFVRHGGQYMGIPYAKPKQATMLR
ncbi:MAG: hypothetical protein NT051_04665 [Candidatus Micrarchaeota archaeon]|nr:hypothetical protein [Candidatus Micrarchaeota archaeon]